MKFCLFVALAIVVQISARGNLLTLFWNLQLYEKKQLSYLRLIM